MSNYALFVVALIVGIVLVVLAKVITSKLPRVILMIIGVVIALFGAYGLFTSMF